MLSILGSAIFLLISLLGWSSLLTAITKVSLRVLTILLGFIVFFWTVSFFTGLGLIVELIAILPGIVLYLLRLDQINLLPFRSRNFLLFSGLVLVFSSFCPVLLDHYGYYIPTINWLKTSGIPLGIANLEWNLGQMSPLHILSAGLSNFSAPDFSVNFLITLIYVLYTVEAKRNILFIFLPYFALLSNSPSPDLFPLVISLIVINELVTKAHNWPLLFLWACFSFVIKPTFFWLPLLVFLFLVYKQKEVTLKAVALASPIIILYLLKNFWVYGDLFFPVSVFNFDVPWRIHPSVLQESNNFAALKTFDFIYSLKTVRSFSAWEYFVNWLLFPGIRGIMNIIILFSLLVLALFSIITKSRSAGIIFWVLTVKFLIVLSFSGQYRFMLDIVIISCFVIFHDKLRERTIISLTATGFLLLTVFFFFPRQLQSLVPSFQLSSYVKPFDANQFVKPCGYDSTPFRGHQIGNLYFNVPADYPFIYKTPLPAISPYNLKRFYEDGIFPQKTVGRFYTGFHWRKLDETQRTQLFKIVQKYYPDQKP